MKRSLLTSLLLVLFTAAFSQTTYTWIGGASGDWAIASNWNPARSTPATSDILVYDNAGTVVSTVSAGVTIGQLQLLNGSNVTLRRPASGTTTIVVGGDGNNATNDLIVDVSSTLVLNSPTSGNSLVLSVGNASLFATALINGTVNISGPATSRLVSFNTNAVVFAAGSTAICNLTIASNYPFGGSSSQTLEKGILFKTGSTVLFQGGNSIFGNTTGFNPISFEPSSTMIFEAPEAAGIFNTRTFANVIVRPLSSAPSTPVTVTVNGAVYNIDTLTIMPLATLNLQTTGVFPVSGNIVNNGTFGAAPGFTTSNLLIDGTGILQSIGGSGTFNALGALSIATNAQVELNTSLVLNGTTTSTITGSLNLKNFSLTGTVNLQARTPQSVAGTSATVSSTNANILVLDATLYNGTTNNANVAVGLLVTGTGIQPNTYIVGTSSGSSQITLSKPVVAGTTSTSVTIAGSSPTIIINNAGGLDAAIATTGNGATPTRSFGSNTNYVFNAATTTPFSTTATSFSTANNITFNASATTNRIYSLNGTLTLGNGKLTIRPLDSLNILAGNAIGGAPFSSSKYIVTNVNTSTGDLGVLRINNLSSATLFPIGSATNYMPATVAPTTTSDFSAAVFEGITTEGTPNGTAFTAMQKQTVVDAVWNITRINGTGDATLTTSWPQSLEGSTFSNQFNIGIMHHDGTSWGPVIGSGNNATNTATATFSSFSPFAVAADPVTLPMNWKDVSASLINGTVRVNWKTANDVDIVKYEVERSSNGIRFSAINNVTANRGTGENLYSVVDASPESINYYRIKSIGMNGEIKYSTVLKVSTGKTNLQVYPNPVSDVLTISGLNPKATIKIVNMAGAVMQNFLPANNTTALSLSVSSLAKGTYVLQVIGENGAETKMFVKQ